VYSLICSAILITVIISEYSVFLNDFDKEGVVFSLIKINVLLLKNSAYFIELYSNKYGTEISEKKIY